MILNALGACVTAVTLVVVISAKFKEGAWLLLVVLPPLIFVLFRVHKYLTLVGTRADADGPVELSDLPTPIVVIPLKRLDRVGRKALALALRLTSDVQVVQILSEDLQTENLESTWKCHVSEPARRNGYEPPKLVVITSTYREFFGPLLDYLAKLAKENPGRPIGVMVPELVEKRWYHFLFRHRATFLKALILMKRGTPGFYHQHTLVPLKNTLASPSPNGPSPFGLPPLSRTIQLNLDNVTVLVGLALGIAGTWAG